MASKEMEYLCIHCKACEVTYGMTSYVPDLLFLR